MKLIKIVSKVAVYIRRISYCSLNMSVMFTHLWNNVDNQKMLRGLKFDTDKLRRRHANVTAYVFFGPQSFSLVEDCWGWLKDLFLIAIFLIYLQLVASVASITWCNFLFFVYIYDSLHLTYFLLTQTCNQEVFLRVISICSICCFTFS